MGGVLGAPLLLRRQSPRDPGPRVQRARPTGRPALPDSVLPLSSRDRGGSKGALASKCPALRAPLGRSQPGLTSLVLPAETFSAPVVQGLGTLVQGSRQLCPGQQPRRGAWSCLPSPGTLCPPGRERGN